MNKVDYPVMYPELFDAVHQVYKDDPDVEADIYLYLSQYAIYPFKAYGLAEQARARLSKMKRCPYCGTKLEYQNYKESHPEIGEYAYEEMSIPYCPYCGMSEVKDDKETT